MNAETVKILIAMILYMLVVVGIGLFFARRANQSSENYFLGGRSLGPWIAAMSAEASDMSGWLLMGLPGVAYWTGLADAAWTAIGLAAGTYLNWLIVSKRLRRYSVRAGNAITLPEFFSNRYHEKKPVLLTLAAFFILIFFTVYAASCLVTVGKLFSTLFGAPYILMMIVGAAFVLIYTILGGFLAESASDFMQGIIMFAALIVVVTAGTAAAGGPATVLEHARSIPGFLDFFGVAVPATDAAGVQQTSQGLPQFAPAAPYGWLSILSTLAWGLGYFGMPQVLLRFMAIRKESELKQSRRIAMVWVLISLAIAVSIGLIGRALYPTALQTASQSENVFIELATDLLPPLFAGFVMAGILAATISSSDSYLLIAASSVARNIFKGLFFKKSSDQAVMRVSRLTLLLITIVAIFIALDENSVIFSIVSFAWAGFGATFGPLMLFSLFWKRSTRAGAIAGSLGGAATVFIWKLAIRPLGGIWGIYELLPAFIISSLLIIVVSLLSPPPSEAIQDEFEAARQGLSPEPADPETRKPDRATHCS
ncbi:sodium/proline symporter [Oscillospiraceae bacterium HV4-5-C5C]|nr:sodium/proline symporter [Oscillospiraceae bacterium HV4-5-C5C]